MSVADELADVIRIDRRTELALDLDQERSDRISEKEDGGPNPSGLCFCGCGESTSIAVSGGREGVRRGQHLRFVKGHQRRLSPVEHIRDEATGCWIWRRATNDLGYGQMTVDGRVVYAHRRYYEIHNGPIEPGHVVDHTCANPSCVNPAHLEAVTSGENIRRGSRGLPSVRKRAADERRAVHVLYDVNRTGNVTPAPVDPPDIAA